jgi:hypothetical protein
MGGTAWNIETVQGMGHIGKQSALAIDTHDKVFISYYLASKKELRLATRNPGEQKWSIHIINIDPSGFYYDGGIFSMALDPAGHPNLAYYDATSQALKYASWIS